MDVRVKNKLNIVLALKLSFISLLAIASVVGTGSIWDSMYWAVDEFDTTRGYWAADADEDGVPDDTDAFPNDAAASLDTDKDGYPDSWNDGKSQSDSTTNLTLDAFPNNADETTDTDGDNIGNNADTDDDGDGYTDQEEIGAGTDPLDSNDMPKKSSVIVKILPLILEQ
jgi:hypothetical protein